MVITSVMVHKQRAIVQAFERAAVTSVASAKTAEQMGLKPGLAWHHLVANAVLRCPAEGRYFLDQANWRRLRRRRQRTAIVVIAALLAGLIAIVWAARGH